MKTILNFIYTGNTGYWLEPILYEHDGKKYIGYILYRGYRVLGIPGNTRIESYIDRKCAEEGIKKLNIKIS